MLTRRYVFFAAAITIYFGGLANACLAVDWPQILGPNRNGVAEGEKIAESFPKGGPKVAWERAVGQGYAGVAVADGKAIIFHRVGGEDVAEALNCQTGEPIWKTAWPTSYRAQYSSDSGPRCVPLVHKGFVYLFAPNGDLHCVALADGKKVWTRALLKDYKADEGYFGAGSTPIILDDKLLLNLGADGDEAGIAAFSLADGETLWTATEEQVSYSSPVLATLNGKPQAVFATRDNALGIDGDGNVLWKFPFGKRGLTVTGANPVVFGDHVFVTASYGIGAACAAIGKGGPKVLWENDASMSSQYTTAVQHEGFLYGIDGREDQGVARLRCIEPKTGKVQWTKDGIGCGTLIQADGKLIVLTTNGKLLLVAAESKAYRQLASAELFDTKTFALPALADGLLYARDEGTLKCLKIGGE